MKFVVVIVILQLMLTCSQFSAGRPQDEGGEQAVEDITGAQCQTLHVLMVHNSSMGMLVTLTSTVNNTVETLSEKNLPNSYLPPECGANNYRCSILHIERSETSYHIVPSIGGFFILSYGTNHVGEEELQMDTSFVAISEKCNPIKAFYNGHYVVVACMDLPIESSGKLFYLQYDFSTPSDTMRSSILTKTRDQSEEIFNTETVSEVIFLTEQSRCQSGTSNLYFIDDAYVVHSPSRLFSRHFDYSTEELQGCVGYLENFRDDVIVIRCTNNQTVLYDTCGAGNFDYQPRDHTPYPCSSQSMIAYRNHTQVSLNRSGEVSVTETLPFEDISYGRCIQGADRPVFIASSADGAIFITRFDGNNFTEIASGNNSGACLRPVFSENELVFGTCDSRSDSLKFVIVNVTEGCTDDSVIAQIPISSTPDLVSVSLGQGTYNCSSCSATQAIELPNTTQTESVAQTEGSTSPNMPTVESDAKTTAATKPARFSTWHERGTVLGPLSFAVSLGLAIFVFIIVYHKCRRARLRHTKREEIFNPNTESHQESHITAGSPRHFNIGLGGPGNCISRNGCCGQCESGNTTTNTSLSEFNLDETPSCAGEQASCYEESVLNSGGHIVSNSGGLPYTSSQLTAPTLYDHHQQRTLDNDTAVTVEYFKSRSR